MRRYSEQTTEGPHQVRHTDTDLRRDLGKCQLPQRMRVEEVSGVGCDTGYKATIVLRSTAQPLGPFAGNVVECRFGRQLLAALEESRVESIDLGAQRLVIPDRPVDRLTDEFRTDHVDIEIDDALTEAVRYRGTTVVHYSRWQ